MPDQRMTAGQPFAPRAIETDREIGILAAIQRTADTQPLVEQTDRAIREPRMTSVIDELRRTTSLARAGRVAPNSAGSAAGDDP